MIRDVAQTPFSLAEQLLYPDGIDPEGPAFCYGGETLTRGSFARLVKALAGGLRSCGAAPDDRVILLLYDTPALPAAFVASLAVGAIPVAINPLSGRETIRFVLRDSRARFAVFEPDQWHRMREELLSSDYLQTAGLICQDLFPEGGDPVIAGSSMTSWVRSAPKEPVGFYKKKPESVAFWQYTSGTTGAPKAVEHTQAGILSCVELFARGVLGIGPQDRIYSAPKMFFGYGQGNSIFFPLQTGAVALLDREWPTVERVRQNLCRFKPTVFFGVPTTYHLLLKEEHRLPLEALSSLRIAFSAGAPLKEGTFATWKNLYGTEILDGIGATEVGHVFMTNPPGKARPGVTGKAVPGYEVRVVGGSGETVPPGEQGVLLVRGPSVSPGYWERPCETLEKFKDGWYRTGDVFIEQDGGFHRYLGREDDLFKVNGRWVIPSEIELHVLTHHEKLTDAALVGVETDEELTVPVLFLVANIREENREALAEKVLESLRNSFEKHKIPRHCFILTELPRNDNGKVVRRRLIDEAGRLIRERARWRE